MTERFGWLFIGAGSIAGRVSDDIIPYGKGSYPAAVYSRTYDRAKAFGDKYGVKAYETFEEALKDPEIRGVYVATPHSKHMDYTMAALDAGFPVLCEKPLTVSAQNARIMTTHAKEKGLYLAEALWTRYNPVIRQVRQWLEDGAIGEVTLLYSNFGSDVAFNPKSRLFAPEDAGGAVYDVGVYTVSMAQMVFKEKPVRIKARGYRCETGVDACSGAALEYADGGMAMLFQSMTYKTPHDVCITGTKGYITIEPPFWNPTKAALYRDGQKTVFEIERGGFQYEFDGVVEEIMAGKLESPLITHEESIEIAGILDEIISQIK